MLTRTRTIMTAGLLVAAVALAAGCRPEPYEQRRPGLGDLHPRDRGLQSVDVIAATDQLAMDLLGNLPELQEAQTQWTIVLTDVENRTADPRFDYDIFIERLRVNLSRHGRGRVMLIENQARLRDLQHRELAHPRDDFGQGGIPIDPGPAGQDPEYALYGRIMELPGRGTSYYRAQFNLTNLETRQQVWSDAYEVRVAR